MGVYIRGMEMPKDCKDCIFCVNNWCVINSRLHHIKGAEETTQYCPLVPVPPHGRLIDADALTDAIESTDWYHQAPNMEMVHGANSAEHQAWYKEQDIYSALEKAPTIIEADPCLSCKHKNVYEPLTKCFVCNFSGIECKNFEMYKPNSQTNADRIRAMTDEELAKLFDSWIQDCDCNDVPCRKSCEEKSVSGCINHWLNWLKEEEEDD